VISLAGAAARFVSLTSILFTASFYLSLKGILYVLQISLLAIRLFNLIVTGQHLPRQGSKFGLVWQDFHYIWE
jgi:hypothetical protein